MADHFEEVVNLRLHQLDERIDDEANAVKEHFEELKTFITEGFATQSAQLRAEFRAKLGPVETDVATLKADVAMLKTDVAGLKTDVAGLKTDVATLKTDVAELKADVAVLKTDVAVLKTDVAVLKTDVAGLKTDVAIMRTDISVLKGDVAGLRREFGRFEDKMDAQFETVRVVLRDIRSRLPPARVAAAD